MKVLPRLFLLAALILPSALHAGPHFDRSYEVLYKNPHPSWIYRDIYAGHYVPLERPYKYITVYERSVYPPNYGTPRYRGPANPTPKVTVYRQKPPFYHPAPPPVPMEAPSSPRFSK